MAWQELVQFSNFCVKDNTAYCFTDRLEELLCVDMQTFRWNADSRYSREISESIDIDRICLCENDIYIYSKRKHIIRVYNTITGALSVVEGFALAMQDEDIAFIKKYRNDTVLAVSRDSNSFCLINNNDVKRIECGMGADNSEGLEKAEISGKYLYALSKDRYNVLIYDLEEHIYHWYKPVNERINSFCLKNEKVFFLTESGTVFSWEYNGIINRVFNEEVLHEYKEFFWGGDKMFFLPDTSDDIYIYNGEKLIRYGSYPFDFQAIGDKRWSKYINPIEFEGKRIYPMRRANYMLFVSLEDGSIEWKSLTKNDDHRVLIDLYRRVRDIIDERYIELSDYLKYIEG